jgi:2-dehydro-3-deoxygalactonokinase
VNNAVSKGLDEVAFTEGFKTAMSDNLLHAVFRVRTRQLLKQASLVSNYQYLSGLLIGTELGELKGKDCPVYLVSSDHLKQAYLLGLHLLELKGRIYFLNEDDMLVNGHCKLAHHYL